MVTDLTVTAKNTIISGLKGLDEKLGGGLPLGSLGLVEGHSDSGKSVLCQHLSYGALVYSDLSVAYYSTENTVKSIIAQMDSLSLYTRDHFLMDHFRIYPLVVKSQLAGSKGPFRRLVEHFHSLPDHFKFIIVDSITLLVAHSDAVSIVDFFSSCKSLCDDGRSVILVAHSYAFPEDILARSRSLCDIHLRLRLEQVGDRMIKMLEVLKVHGAEKLTGDVVSFEVEPKLGMRVIPLAKAKV